MTTVQAILHTTGVVLGKRYVPLELSFTDATGFNIHFHLNSPLSYREAITLFPHARPDAIMTTQNGISFEEVVRFLQFRYRELLDQFPRVVVGCKGGGYQMQVLRSTQLPDTVDLDTLGVPSLKTLSSANPLVCNCSWHTVTRKCSRVAIQLLANYVFQQKLILPLGQQEPFGQTQRVGDGTLEDVCVATRLPQIIQMRQSQ